MHPNHTKISVDVPDTYLEALYEVGRLTKLNRSDLVRSALKLYLDQYARQHASVRVILRGGK